MDHGGSQFITGRIGLWTNADFIIAFTVWQRKMLSQRRGGFMKPFALVLALTGTLLADSSWAETPLLLERKIPLGEVRGRIDHLAVDLKRNRLFVAELENDTVAVVDLEAYKVVEVISGLKKPQGVGYHPPTDALYVANGGDGTLAIFRGDDYREGSVIVRLRCRRIVGD